MVLSFYSCTSLLIKQRRLELINVWDVVAAAGEACAGDHTNLEPAAKRLKVPFIFLCYLHRFLREF